MTAPGKPNPPPPLFETRRLDQSRPGKLTFVKLLKKGACQFDDFLTQLEREGGYDKEVDKAINLMDQLARCKPLRGPQHHALGTLGRTVKGKTHTVTCYEIKTANLRIYYFHHPPNTEIVVFMGKKNTQPTDLSAFESLVGRYLEFIYS